MTREPITLNLFITKNDIAVGRREDCSACPVARALRRAAKRAGIPYARALVEARLSISTDTTKGMYVAKYSETVKKFILKFDNPDRWPNLPEPKPFRARCTFTWKPIPKYLQKDELTLDEIINHATKEHNDNASNNH